MKTETHNRKIRLLELEKDREILEGIKNALQGLSLTSPGPILEPLNEMILFTMDRITDEKYELAMLRD